MPSERPPEQNMFSQFAKTGGEYLARCMWAAIEDVLPAMDNETRMRIIQRTIAKILKGGADRVLGRVQSAAESALFKVLGIDLSRMTGR